MTREAPQVRILDSAEALAKARVDAAAYAAAQHPPEISLESLEYIGRSMLTRAIKDYARAGEPFLERLRVLAAATGAPAFAACACLVQLGHVAYATRLPELLATETSPALGECFKWIGMNGDLVRRLPDVDVLRQHVEAIAQAPDHPDREQALRAAFELETELATVEIVEALVRAGRATRYPESWITHALARIARRGGDPGLAAARALLQPPFLDSRSASQAGVSRDRRLTPDLERVLSSAPKKDVVGGALQALAYVQGIDAMPRLLEALEDPEQWGWVPTAIGIAAEGSGDESVVAALSMAAAGSRIVGPHAMAIARVGGPLAWRTLAGLCKRVTVYDAMYAAWRAKGITATSAIRRFVDAGVVPVMPMEPQLRAAAETPVAWEPNDVWLFFDVLRKSGRTVDATGEDIDAREAAQHPVLIERFAQVTKGAIAIEHLSQIDGPKDSRDERELQIQFVAGERVFQTTTKTLGRNFDLPAIRALLNAALSDRGCEERFTRMQGLDFEFLIFGPQAAVEVACDEICLPYGAERAGIFAWQDRLQRLFLQTAGTEFTPRDFDGLAFHIIRPAQAGAFPHDAVGDMVTRVLGSASSLTVKPGSGWTEVELRITRQQFSALGAEAIETLFVSMCDVTEAHLGRTLSGSNWARVAEGELAGAVDALDWLQYYGPRFGKWLRARSKLLTASHSPRGAEVVKLELNPLSPAWLPREQAASAIYLRLRPLPPSSQPELDPAARLQRVSPPEPAPWKPEQRQAIFRTRAGTLQAIEKGMANGRLFDRFRRRYLADELESSRLDRIALWLPHYGAAAATAAFRSVARLHDAHPAAAAMDDVALEGCVKLVAWGGDERPLLERELMVEHLVDPKDPAMAVFARSADDPDSVAGLIKMTAMQLAVCNCERCTETRRILGRKQP